MIQWRKYPDSWSLTHPIQGQDQRDIQDSKKRTNHIKGDTKLKTWKLFSLVASEYAPLASKPMIRRMKAVMRRQSVVKATTFQNVKERQEAKLRSLYNWTHQIRSQRFAAKRNAGGFMPCGSLIRRSAIKISNVTSELCKPSSEKARAMMYRTISAINKFSVIF